MTKNIFMLGMPSSGKSTLGRQLAKKIGYEFIDLDFKIEVAEGKKIGEIFNLEGEEYFRKAESEQLKKITPESKVVVATGGGTPLFHDNLDYIKSNGICIFLDVKPNELSKRMRSSRRNNRPLLDINADTLDKDVEKIYNERIDIYKQANVIIEGDTDADTILWILDAEFPNERQA
ncbi:MAG: shikimate kinase [Spirosomaceae bacterium]|nr:shikimate kinase [Spirosomataceae bacterium]